MGFEDYEFELMTSIHAIVFMQSLQSPQNKLSGTIIKYMYIKCLLG